MKETYRNFNFENHLMKKYNSCSTVIPTSTTVMKAIKVLEKAGWDLKLFTVYRNRLTGDYIIDYDVHYWTISINIDASICYRVADIIEIIISEISDSVGLKKEKLINEALLVLMKEVEKL